MKKSVLVAFIFLILILPIVIADTNSSVSTNGFSCLANKTTDCSSLSLGQQVFTSLATGLCTGNVVNSSSQNGCWPSGNCDIKTTSEAILALNHAGENVSNATSWIFSQNMTTSNIMWYLQVDSNNAATCEVNYPGYSGNFHLDSNKQIREISVGTCLTKSPNGYWLAVSPSCFGEKISVSCNESFTTTKLYQRSPTSQYSTIYLSNSSQSASSGANLTNSFYSSCFGTGGQCSYESTLWATLVLDKLGYDVSNYLPYLITEAGDSSNSGYMPYAFLYALTYSSDYLTNLIGSEKTVNGKNYWEYSNDPYFGTSLALLAIKSTDTTDSTAAMNWLQSVQQPSGCWNNGNILSTAFVLYSAYGSKELAPASTSPAPQKLCSSVGYCLSTLSCTQDAGGNVLTDYSSSCPGIQICCSNNIKLQTCSDLGGNLCNSTQICNVSTISSSDSTSTSLCCPSTGSCVTPAVTPSNSCGSIGGICRNACLSSEIQSTGVCSSSNQICCTPSLSSEQVSSGSNVALIIILIILIALAVLGIVFRKRLIPLWQKIKAKILKGKGKGGSQGQGPGTGPRRPPFPPRGPPSSFQRRPMPPQRPPQQMHPTPGARRPAPKASSDVNDVLKKLRDMGK